MESHKRLQVKRAEAFTLRHFGNTSANMAESVALQRGDWNVPQRDAVPLSVCLLVCWASSLWRVGEAGADMVSLPLAGPGPAADSRSYLMWMSRVGFQRWLQHMISIMTRGATHAGG